eukprot:11316927-Prorocentrum_lima.AAC.1
MEMREDALANKYIDFFLLRPLSSRANTRLDHGGRLARSYVPSSQQPFPSFAAACSLFTRVPSV